MIISILAALDENRGIGLENRIPWHLPADLKLFKKLTMGHYLILGRKTYQSIGGPLPGRKMIILTRNPDFQATDNFTAGSLMDALQIAEADGEKEVFIIGGAEVYQQSLPLADHLYLTSVLSSAPADTFFPQINESEWSLICEQYHPADETNPFDHTFRHMVKKGSLAG